MLIKLLDIKNDGLFTYNLTENFKQKEMVD